MRKTWLLFAVGVAVLLAVLPRAAHGASAHSQSNSQTFPDSIGENPNAPDITSIVVSNDDAGNIVFKINISNRPTFTPDMELQLVMNTDGSTTTGDPTVAGADYLIDLIPGSVGLFQWSGSDYTFAQSQSSLVYSYDSTGATIRINASDLGATKVITFGAVALSGITTDANGNPDYTNAQADLAPDAGHGFFTYQVKTKLLLTQTAFSTAPAAAKVGKKFSASLAATESDTNGPVTAPTIACKAVVAGKTLKATHTFAGGVSTCSWVLPKTKVKGKLIYGTISITVQGTKLSKSFTARIH
ncbi:MAG TPA: hypothetical protein VGL84_00305 [Gaiellaceae bacterium]